MLRLGMAVVPPLLALRVALGPARRKLLLVLLASVVCVHDITMVQPRSEGEEEIDVRVLLSPQKWLTWLVRATTWRFWHGDGGRATGGRRCTI